MNFDKYDTVQVTGHLGSTFALGRPQTIRGLLSKCVQREVLGFYCFEDVSIFMRKKHDYNNYQIRQAFSGVCKIQLCRIVLVEKKIRRFS